LSFGSAVGDSPVTIATTTRRRAPRLDSPAAACNHRRMKPTLLENRGVPLERQKFTWRDMVQKPISKLDDDAYTRVRIILMNGIELEAHRFSHSAARMNRALQAPLAQVRRIEQHQATLINWLIGPDHSPLETTIAYEQVAIDVTAAVAMNEPDEYLAQVYRFGLLEDFDHMYRYSALLDRLEGKDANNILQSYTDILPGRPTIDEHRAPVDDLRRPYDRKSAAPLSKLHALTIMAAEQQTHNFYMNIGPMYSDPVARQLYAEIASIEEQHVTQYESIIDPEETWLEKWVMHELGEVYNYHGCMEQESNPRIKAIWERFLDYELGHLHLALELFKKHEKRDPEEILPASLPEPIPFASQREFVRETLAAEVDLRANGTEIVPKEKEGKESLDYRKAVNADGSPSETVAAGYKWAPGSELKLKVA
jgi:rubrerythrin